MSSASTANGAASTTSHAPTKPSAATPAAAAAREPAATPSSTSTAHASSASGGASTSTASSGSSSTAPKPEPKKTDDSKTSTDKDPAPTASAGAAASATPATGSASASTTTGAAAATSSPNDSTPTGLTASPSQAASMSTGAPFDPAKHHAIVEKLLAAKGSKAQKQVLLREDEIKLVLNDAREVFMSQDMLLEITPPIKICGDVHGQFYDLMRIFDKCGFPPQANYLFLGDYVDRGKHSVETIILLFCYKCLYRETFFLLRGNHECAAINKMYGFFDDVKRRYNIRLFKQFTDVFNTMPVACCISDKILCMHGGLSPDLQSLQSIRNLARPCDVPDRGLLCDLLWADPEEEVKGYVVSDRGVSYLFGEDVVSEFLDDVDMDLVVRAHQVMEKGYGFFAARQLVTLFSAPSYCGEFDNDAAIMNIDDKLQCSFIIVYAKS